MYTYGIVYSYSTTAVIRELSERFLQRIHTYTYDMCNKYIIPFSSVVLILHRSRQS